MTHSSKRIIHIKKQSMKLRAISIFLTLLVTYNYISAEEISHNSIIHGRWTVENSPYIVMGIAIVPEDSTLIIDPGVTVLLKSSTEYTDFYYETIGVGLIKVYGNIIANGTETDSITFSRNQDGLWGSISILNSNERISEFKFCNFEFGSSVYDAPGGPNNYSGALGIKNSNVDIYNSTYQYNEVSIISINSIVKIKECLIKSNSNGIAVYESNAQIKNNQLINNQLHGITSAGSTSEILNNIAANNGQYGIRSTESNDSIASNLIFDNQYSGILISGDNAISYRNIIWGSNSGIRVNSGKPRIVNNIIVFNNYFGIYFGWQAQPYIVNSIIFGNQALAYYNEQDTAVFAYSLLQTDSLPSNFLNGGGNIFNLDPSFVDEHNHDFALCEDSPCIDSGAAFFIWEGDTIVQLSSEEYNGNAPDIGAIESEYLGTIIVDLSHTSINFGEETVGYDVPTPVSVTITNIGTETLTNLKVELSGDDAEVFLVTQPVPDNIETGESSTFTVVPEEGLSDGLYNAIVEITSDEGVSETINVIFNVVDEPTYLVTTSVNPEGSGSVSGTGSYVENAEVTLTADANSGYKFVGWTDFLGIDPEIDLIDGTTVDDDEIKFNMPAEEVNLTANFEAIVYDITYVLDDGDNHEDNPATFTIEALPVSLGDASKAGHTFKGWYLEDTFDTEVTQITEIGDITLYAEFVPYTYVENDWLKFFRLIQNYPNPFKESTIIMFNLIDYEETYLVIYNLSGRIVRSYKIIGIGPQIISWDGKDYNGNSLNAGVYIYSLYTKHGIYSNTMVLSR
jgi:uncharacterized repeat protein (TIGR02543 family)